MSHRPGPPQEQQPHGQQPAYGQQPMYGQPSYTQPPTAPPPVKGGNGVGIASLAIGVLAGVCAFAPQPMPVYGFLLGLVAAGLAISGVVRVTTRKADSMIIAVMALIVSIAAIVAVTTVPTMLTNGPTTQDDVTACLNDPATDTADEILACAG